MDWTIAQAKQRFSEVVRAAEREPQKIFNRNRLVAAVVDARAVEKLEELEARERGSIEDAFAEIRAYCAETGYELEVPERKDRPNPFVKRVARRG
jgi:prevent-host-death family protein